MAVVKYCNACKEFDREFEDAYTASCIICDAIFNSDITSNKIEIEKAFKNIYDFRKNVDVAIRALRDLFLDILMWTCKDAKSYEGHMYKNYYLPTFTEPFQKLLLQSRDKEDFLNRWYLIFF